MDEAHRVVEQVGAAMLLRASFVLWEGLKGDVAGVMGD